MDLSIDQVKYLKALWDDAILVNCPEFEYPCFFSYPDLSEEKKKDLEEKDLIGWYDGWHITYDGMEVYQKNKHRFSYHGGKNE